MDLDEALRLGDEIADPESRDVITVLRDAIRELQERCAGRAEPPTAAEMDMLAQDGVGPHCFRFVTEAHGLRFSGTAYTTHAVAREEQRIGAAHCTRRWFVERRDGAILPWSSVAPKDEHG